MKIINFIKDMFNNYLITKTYKELMNDVDSKNQIQMDILFGNVDGIELH